MDGQGIDEHLTQSRFEDGEVAETLFYSENHRGDTIALTDSTGQVISRFEYLAYGEVFKVNEQNELEPFTDFALAVYTFQGRRADEETSLMYFRHRYYDAKQGRWLSRDALGYVDSLNLYSFARQNPYDLSDPLGLDPALRQRLRKTIGRKYNYNTVEHRLAEARVNLAIARALSYPVRAVANQAVRSARVAANQAVRSVYALAAIGNEGMAAIDAFTTPVGGKGVFTEFGLYESGTNPKGEFIGHLGQAAAYVWTGAGTPKLSKIASKLPSAQRIKEAFIGRSDFLNLHYGLDRILSRMYTREAGYFDVALHGTNLGNFVAQTSFKTNRIPLELVVKMTIQHPNFHGQNVRLLSCWSGSSGLGKKYADTMAKYGYSIRVKAPTIPINVPWLWFFRKAKLEKNNLNIRKLIKEDNIKKIEWVIIKGE